MGDTKVLTIADLKDAATAKLPGAVRDYYNEGAMDMITLRENERAFDVFKIQPRVLVDVSNVDVSTTFLGKKVSLPFGFAPSAMHKLAHPDGERATARVAGSRNLAMCLSTYSTVSLEDVFEVSGGIHPLAFHLMIMKDRKRTVDWIKRAEATGYRALFITVDAPVVGHRLNETRTPFTLPDHLSLPNMSQDGTRSHHDQDRDSSCAWADLIPWIRAQTKLEIWLKGVLSAEDVLLAVQHGVDGVVVSNHGGRQLDGVPATILALAECADAAQGRIKIGIDGGIRRGTDIFKALALGADICFLGRVVLWGLAHGGEDGLGRAVDILEQELRTTMALAGCSSLGEISRHHLSTIGANGLLCRL